MQTVRKDLSNADVDAPSQFVEFSLVPLLGQFEAHSGYTDPLRNIVGRMERRRENFKARKSASVRRAVAYGRSNLQDLWEFASRLPYSWVRRNNEQFRLHKDHEIYKARHCEYEWPTMLPMIGERGRGKIGDYEKSEVERWSHLAIYGMPDDPRQPRLIVNDPEDIDFLLNIRRKYGLLAKEFFDAAVQKRGDVYGACELLGSDSAKGLLQDVLRYSKKKKTVLPVYFRLNGGPW